MNIRNLHEKLSILLKDYGDVNINIDIDAADGESSLVPSYMIFSDDECQREWDHLINFRTVYKSKDLSDERPEWFIIDRTQINKILERLTDLEEGMKNRKEREATLGAEIYSLRKAVISHTNALNRGDHL